MDSGQEHSSHPLLVLKALASDIHAERESQQKYVKRIDTLRGRITSQYHHFIDKERQAVIQRWIKLCELHALDPTFKNQDYDDISEPDHGGRLTDSDPASKLKHLSGGVSADDFADYEEMASLAPPPRTYKDMVARTQPQHSGGGKGGRDRAVKHVTFLTQEDSEDSDDAPTRTGKPPLMRATAATGRVRRVFGNAPASTSPSPALMPRPPPPRTAADRANASRARALRVIDRRAEQTTAVGGGGTGASVQTNKHTDAGVGGGGRGGDVGVPAAEMVDPWDDEQRRPVAPAEKRALLDAPAAHKGVNESGPFYQHQVQVAANLAALRHQLDQIDQECQAEPEKEEQARNSLHVSSDIVAVVLTNARQNAHNLTELGDALRHRVQEIPADDRQFYRRQSAQMQEERIFQENRSALADLLANVTPPPELQMKLLEKVSSVGADLLKKERAEHERLKAKISYLKDVLKTTSVDRSNLQNKVRQLQTLVQKKVLHDDKRVLALRQELDQQRAVNASLDSLVKMAQQTERSVKARSVELESQLEAREAYITQLEERCTSAVAEAVRLRHKADRDLKAVDKAELQRLKESHAEHVAVGAVKQLQWDNERDALRNQIDKAHLHNSNLRRQVERGNRRVALVKLFYRNDLLGTGQVDVFSLTDYELELPSDVMELLPSVLKQLGISDGSAVTLDEFLRVAEQLDMLAARPLHDRDANEFHVAVDMLFKSLMNEEKLVGISELDSAMNTAGVSCATSTIRALVEEEDQDEDDRLTFADFLRLCVRLDLRLSADFSSKQEWLTDCLQKLVQSGTELKETSDLRLAVEWQERRSVMAQQHNRMQTRKLSLADMKRTSVMHMVRSSSNPVKQPEAPAARRASVTDPTPRNKASSQESPHAGKPKHGPRPTSSHGGRGKASPASTPQSGHGRRPKPSVLVNGPAKAASLHSNSHVRRSPRHRRSVTPTVRPETRSVAVQTLEQQRLDSTSFAPHMAQTPEDLQDALAHWSDSSRAASASPTAMATGRSSSHSSHRPPSAGFHSRPLSRGSPRRHGTARQSVSAPARTRSASIMVRGTSGISPGYAIPDHPQRSLSTQTRVRHRHTVHETIAEDVFIVPSQWANNKGALPPWVLDERYTASTARMSFSRSASSSSRRAPSSQAVRIGMGVVDTLLAAQARADNEPPPVASSSVHDDLHESIERFEQLRNAEEAKVGQERTLTPSSSWQPMVGGSRMRRSLTPADITSMQLPWTASSESITSLALGSSVVASRGHGARKRDAHSARTTRLPAVPGASRTDSGSGLLPRKPRPQSARPGGQAHHGGATKTSKQVTPPRTVSSAPRRVSVTIPNPSSSRGDLL